MTGPAITDHAFIRQGPTNACVCGAPEARHAYGAEGQLPGGPIASSRVDDDWPARAENVVQDFLDEGWTVADEPPPLASSLFRELGRFGFRVVQEPSEWEEPVHRRSRFPASSGKDRGKHYCMECTTYCRDGTVYVVWPCRTARAVAEGRLVADALGD